MIQDILDLMKDNSRIELRRFNKIDKCVLAELARKINCILKNIRTENSTETNILIKPVIIYVGNGLQIIFQNLSDMMPGKNKISSDLYENLSDINFYKCF